MKNLVYIWGFDIKQGRGMDFQQWLSGNEEKIAMETPEGCEYMGTYTTVIGGDAKDGQGRTFWGFDNYGGQDAWSAAMKAGGSFTRLVEEFTEFIDQDNHANGSAVLTRRVTDAAIWGE